jgi:hypothetical protein
MRVVRKDKGVFSGAVSDVEAFSPPGGDTPLSGVGSVEFVAGAVLSDIVNLTTVFYLNVFECWSIVLVSCQFKRVDFPCKFRDSVDNRV